MRQRVKQLAFLLLVLVFAVSAVMTVRRGLDYQEGEQVYTEAEELAQLPDWTELPDVPIIPAPEEEPEPPSDVSEEESEPVSVPPPQPDPYREALQAMDFTALQEVNPDVLGWILIPGTAISYPVVQGTDNTYYLTHTWKKTVSAVGSIFLEARNRADFSDGNTVLYGHRMNNGSMFAALKYYKKQSYWAAHPDVYITDRNGSRRYEIFAAYEVSTSGAAYQIGFSGTESKAQFLEDCVSRSVISTGVTPGVSDRILTLSTCTGNGHATRWVVQARLPVSKPAAEESEEEAPSETPRAAEESPADDQTSVDDAPAEEPETPEPADGENP